MKILIIHASAGAGHMKAAEALHEGLKNSSNHDVTLVDALNYTSPQFKKLYRGTYSFLITKIPFVWGFAFAFLDIEWVQPLVRLARRVYNSLNCQGVHQLMIEGQFDYILSTHFMPNEIASALKKKELISSKVISCVTDFDVHRIWLGSGVDTYAVASLWTKEKLTNLGVKSDNIFVTGIPTNEKFSRPYDIVALKNKLGLLPDSFTVLIATGSFGIGPIEKIIEALNGFQVIVICGHNENLYERLSPKATELIKVFGLVDNMHELMAVSDVMVTKPGGLSISEALVSELPLIFFNAIPGQETNNIKVLKTYDVGMSDCSIGEIAGELKRLKSSKDAFESVRSRSRTLARPFAVRDVITLIHE